MKLSWLIVLLLALTSCIDITDEILLKGNGQGVFQRTTDYAKTFAGLDNPQDSLAMANQAETDHQNLLSKFKSVNGIHNVHYNLVYGTHQYRIGFEYDNYEALNRALLQDGEKNLFEWKKGELTITGGVAGLRGNGTDDSTASGRAMLAKALQDANYTLIVTVPRKVKKCSNKQAVKKKNVLTFRETLDQLIFDPSKTQMTIRYK